MPLTTYEEVRPWAKAIKEEVLNRRMPPWGAVPGFVHLRNDQSLTLTEVAAIADWVEGGAPEGDSKYLPPPAAVRAEPLPKTGAAIPVRTGERTKAPILLQGVELVSHPAGSVRVFADLPDGSTKPLIWLYEVPKRAPVYYFEATELLPAGTQIRTVPQTDLSLKLLPALPIRRPPPGRAPAR